MYDAMITVLYPGQWSLLPVGFKGESELFPGIEGETDKS
jgi:hypothetical protein